MSLLLKNARIVDLFSSKNTELVDIFIEDGIVKKFSAETAKNQIDLEGKLVTPGWFDLNANFNDPGNELKEDIQSGSKAASFGGFTDVNLSPDTHPPIESKSDINYLLRRSEKILDLHATGALSEGILGENLTEILDLHSAGALSFSDGDNCIWNAELLLKALQYTSKIDVPIIQNPRDKNLSAKTHMHEGFFSTQLGVRGEPSLSEELIVKRDIDILKYSGGRLHFSGLSTAGAVEQIKIAKKEKLNVTCDVSIHHLLFSDSSVGEFDTNFKVKPPYRLESDRKALIKGVKEGVIDVICSLHRPQDQESKELEFDLAEFGNIALQTFYPSLLTISKDIPLEKLIDRITNGPREVLGLPKCKVEIGEPAKLTIVDPEAEWTFNETTNLSKSQNSPFWNKTLKGKVFGTINLNSYLIH